MNEFNERFLSEIAYYRRPVKEFSQKYEYQGEFEVLLCSFIDSLKMTNGKNPALPFRYSPFSPRMKRLS